MQFQVDVTQEDIDKGIKHDAACCPIALAFRRLYPFCMAGVYNLFFCDQDGIAIMKAPLEPEAVEFIKDFDCGKPIQPFSFTFNLNYDELQTIFDYIKRYLRDENNHNRSDASRLGRRFLLSNERGTQESIEGC